MIFIPSNYNLHRRLRQVARRRPAESVRFLSSSLLSRLDIMKRKFPGTVAVELTGDCNLACPTCPQPLMDEERGFMERGLYKKIVDECANSPSHVHLVFTGFGEPLLHPSFMEMARYAKERGIPVVRAVTNCLLLCGEMVEKILSEPGIDEITLSLNAYDEEAYILARGARGYTQVAENVQRFLVRKRELGRDRPFVFLKIFRLKGLPADPGKAARRWLPLLGPGDCVQVRDPHTFAGQLEDFAPENMTRHGERRPCGQLWNFMHVSWRGECTPCCVDPFQRHNLGNVGDFSLKDLWCSPMLGRMRRLHLRGDYASLPLCGACDTWDYFG